MSSAPREGLLPGRRADRAHDVLGAAPGQAARHGHHILSYRGGDAGRDRRRAPVPDPESITQELNREFEAMLEGGAGEAGGRGQGGEPR